ncbi:MAG: acyl carrier protein [bacterium]
MLNDEEIIAKIKKIVSDVLNVKTENLTFETHYQNDLGVDSVEMITLLVGFETECKCTISENEFRKLKTIGDTFHYIKTNILRDEL